MAVSFEDIVATLESDKDMITRVGEKFSLKTQDEIDELTNGLVKKKTELLDENKKSKEALKAAQEISKEYDEVKSLIKTLNLEGVFADNDSIDLIVLGERVKDVAKRLTSAGQSPDTPKELADARTEVEGLKKELLEHKKLLDKTQKEYNLSTSNLEALTSEKHAADQALTNVMVNQEFKTLLVGRGMNVIQAEAIASYLIQSSGAKVFRDESGIYKAGCEDGMTTISDWLDGFALTPAGKALIPEAPVTGGGSTNASGKSNKTFKDFTPGELVKLSKTDPKEYARVMATRK